MKLLEINVDRFGPWRDLALPLDGEFSLFYGPNEAGKSSLLRFVRGVLFGFRPEHPNSSGTLEVEHRGRRHTIRREADGGRGELSVSGVGEGQRAERWVSDALGGVGEQLFETVFAIGLDELQKLANLDHEQVAESIYGLSLGPEGERVMRAEHTLREGRERLLDGEGRGRLTTLLRRRDELDRELRGLPDAWDRAEELSEERDRLRRTIEESDGKRNGLRHDLRGLNFMERVYEPWRKQRTLIEERDRLGQHDFPLDAPDRLMSVERELSRVEEERRRLRGEDARLKKEYDRLGERSELLEQACRVETLLAEENRVRDLRDKLKDLDRIEKENAARLRERPQPRRIDVGDITTSFTAPQTGEAADLLSRADEYRAAGRSYKRRVSRLKKNEAKHKKQVSQFRESLRKTGKETLEDAVKAAEARLKQLENVRLLSHRERLLEAQLNAANRTATYRGDQDSIVGAMFDNLECCDDGMPKLFVGFLWLYAVGGFFVMLAGGYVSLVHVWWLGLLYMVAGLSFLGITYLIRKMGGAELGDSGAEQANSEAKRTLETELRQTREEMDRIDPLPDGGQVMYRGRSVNTRSRLRDDIERQIGEARDVLVGLKALGNEEDRLRRNKETLSRMRNGLRGERQKKTDARNRWTRTLRAAGLDETLKTSDALASWQRSQNSLFADAAKAATAAAAMEVEPVEIERVDVGPARTVVKDELRRFEDRVGELAVRLGETAPAEPFAWLRRLNVRIEETRRQREERLKLRRQRKDLRSRLASLDSERERFGTQRADVYASAGVTTKDEFEARKLAMSRVGALAEQIDAARNELTRIASTETELAIVEDDLMAFDAAQNKRAIEDTNEELAALDRVVEDSRQRLGRVEAELDELASDRTASRLRFEREQVAGELEELAEDYLAAGVALRSLDDVRGQVERNCQPETLRRAGHFLEKLTLGKYGRVWTRLGTKELLITDGQGDDWTVERLSTGTREQLFLALRLALAEEFAAQGGELPIVLDDVLVNFDQSRTEAAIATLAEVADGGQQVLMFSCHLHVTKLLEELGRDAVFLPGREPAVTRMAG